MKKEKGKKQKKPRVFQVKCSCCNASLWIDPETQEVIKSEKGKKKKGSLDELLIKEKKRKSEFDRKFEATAQLEKERWKKAQEKFEKALTDVEKEE